MIKLCFVTTISLTLKTFVMKTAEFLHENGDFDITFICDYDEEFEKLLPEYIHYIPVSMKRGVCISGLKSLLDLISIFRREKFDLVQYSTPNASLYAAVAARIVGVPVRLYCQWGIVYVGFEGLKRWIFKQIEKLVCRLSTFIEPDSFGNLNFSIAEGLYSKEKSGVIWNGSASGVDLVKFDFTQKDTWRREIRNNYHISDDEFVIGFVGRINKDKGINELFAACRNLFERKTHASLMLVGAVECGEMLDLNLYQWSQNCQRVIYCGRTNEVEKFLSAMDIFVLPSYREGFGTVVIEAEAMGLPVVVSDIPGPTDAMQRDVTGLCVPVKNVDELEAAILRLWEDKEFFAQCAENARTFAKDKFEQKELFYRILEDRRKMAEKVTDV